jgi:hypothetical protein
MTWSSSCAPGTRPSGSRASWTRLASRLESARHVSRCEALAVVAQQPARKAKKQSETN